MKPEKIRTDRHAQKQSAFRICFGLKKLWAGILFAALSFGLCCIAGASNTATLFFSVMFLAVSVVELKCNAVAVELLLVFWGIASTFITVFASQLLLNESTFSLGILRILLNMAICGSVMGLLYCITARIRLSAIAGMAAFVIFTAVNYFVFAFRGSELCPADFLSLGTAMAVADRYTFAVDAPFAYAIMLAALYLFAGFCIEGMPVPIPKRRVFGAFSTVFLVLFVMFGSGNLAAYHFLQTGSVTNGYFLNFVLEIEENIIVQPATYSLKEVQTIESDYNVAEDRTAEDASPAIIVIMNESFADLSVLGSELQTNIDVLPYYHSLTENVIKGNALSSVIGGGTANSEYEFLSGNTMGFLPMGSIVYQQFIYDNPYTLVPFLKELGYSTLATHPSDAQNWMRDSVYPRMGFDRIHFIEDYPQEDLLRGFVSDREMYEQIVRWYEEYKEEEKLFLFGISMQNHGFYYYEGEDFQNTVQLEGYSGRYADVEQYLSVLHQSDLALEYLIRYFQNAERDVIILFYGDHFPKLDGRFYEEVHGGTFDTLDEQMLQYTVPFFIWTNYDIEEQFVELTSLNFLSTLLLENAGIQLPAYSRFLADVRRVIPAINSYGYYSNEQGKFVGFEEATGIEAEMIRKYQIMQYNCIFGKEDTSALFFPFDSDK